MIQRQKNILMDLRYSNVCVKEISRKYDVTDRTIRNDIKNINEKLEKNGAIIIKNDLGEYSLNILDNSKFNLFESKELLCFEFDYSEPENRVMFILLKLLFAEKHIKLEDLMDEMYISRSSIQNDMKDVREILGEYKLDIDVKPNYGIKIIGSERNIRNTISNIINKINLKSFNTSNQDFDLVFDKTTIDKITNILIKNITNSDIKLSDFALNNLVVHISIAIKRIKINKYFEKRIESDLDKSYEYKIAKNIVLDIEENFDVKFPLDEVYYITMHLMGTKLVINHDFSVSNQEKDEDKEIISIAKQIISEVEKKLRYRISSDEELFSAIVLHLKPAIYRFKNNMNIRNPLLSSIKVNYPIAFDAAKIAGDIVLKNLGISFNDDELGYIAIHLGAAIERAKLNIKPIRTLLVCTTGLGSSKLLKYKLEAKFSNKMEIVDTTELYNIKNYLGRDLDLIISTVPFIDDIDVPNIYINDILGESNFSEIQNFIDKFNNYESISFLSSKDIFINLDFDCKKDVLKFLSSYIVSTGRTAENLYDSILNREAIACTSFGNLVAVPHPIDMISNSTFITIGILNRPINWGTKDVQVVIILNVDKNSEEKFEDMYKVLLEIIDSKENVKKLINAKTEEEVYNIIMNSI